MPLTQKHRSSIYRSLSPLLGEEEAEALLNEFPAREVDELVTRGHLRAELAGVRAELADVRGELRSEFADVRGEFRSEFAVVRTEIAELRAEMHALIRQQTVWFSGAMVAGLSLSATIASLL